MYVTVHFEKVIEQKEHRIILLKGSTHGLDTMPCWYHERFGGYGRGDLSRDRGPPLEVASGHIGHIGQVSPQGLALEQLAPVTCSISRAPGDHIASNTPDTLHY